MLKLISAEPGKEYREKKPIGKPTEESRIPLEFATTLPTQMVEANIPAIEITGGGEPTLWARFNELVRNLQKNNREIGLVTNGSNLNEERIKLISKACLWIRVSMDSATQETHKKIHRTGNDDFERRIRNIKRIAKLKHDNLVLGISFIITPENLGDIDKACGFYSSIEGINNLRFSWMYDKEGHAGLDFNTIEEVKKALDTQMDFYNDEDFHIYYEKNRIDLYSKPNNDFDTCYYQRFVWAIGADCKVYPCCIMKYHPDYAYADIRERTLAQIVNDLKTKTFMDNLIPARCRPCWLRNRNKAIRTAVEEPIHVNFI